MKTRSHNNLSSKNLAKKAARAKPLFSKLGKRALTAWAKGASVLLAFDLDGTLVPLIRDFTRVKLSPRSRRLLVELSASRRVVIVSGRASSDLRRIVKTGKIKLVGNHGLEGVKKLTRPIHVKEWHRQLSAALEGHKGVQIEDKKISISVHYRNSPNHRAVRKLIFALLPDLQGPLRVIMGKSVFNIIPDFGQNKGWAIQKLMKAYRCSHALYVGDDITDEDVFILRDKNIMGIHIGSPTKTAANFFLRNQTEVVRLLAYINELP